MVAHAATPEPAFYFKFRASCPVEIVGHTPKRLWADIAEPPGYDAEGAHDRRLDLAVLLHDYELVRHRCELTPTRLLLVGYMRLRPWNDRQRLDSTDASRTLKAMLSWTLEQVYGHDRSDHPGRAIPQLSYSIRELVRARPA